MEYRMKPGLLELIAGITLLKVEGASGIAARRDHEERTARKKNMGKGIHCQATEESVRADLDIMVTYGKEMYEVAGAVQREVAAALGNMTGLRVDEVNVNIVGVTAI